MYTVSQFYFENGEFFANFIEIIIQSDHDYFVEKVGNLLSV